MKKRIAILLLAVVLASAGCGSAQATATTAPAPAPTGGTTMQKSLRLFINDTEVTVDWEDNESAAALLDLASAQPLTVQMSMYGGFEQVGSLGTSLPRSDERITTQTGDIVLYSGDQIVVFYGSNSWAYTRLGRITELSAEDLTELLANGDVAITLSTEQVEEK